MKKKVFLFISVLLFSCSSGMAQSEKTTQPAFEIKKISNYVVPPLFAGGLNHNILDSAIIKANHITQCVCYAEDTSYSGGEESLGRWKVLTTYTFDTNGNWIQYTRADDTIPNLRLNPLKKADGEGSWWSGHEYFSKSGGTLYYRKYSVKDGVGVLIYDSLNVRYKSSERYTATLYRGDTIIIKSKGKEAETTVLTRNAMGQITHVKKFDCRGLFETESYEYDKGKLAKTIKQNLADMTEDISITIIEYNEIQLPVSLKQYFLDNGVSALEEYKAGKSSPQKVTDIWVEWKTED